MKFHGTYKRINYSISIIGMLFALGNSEAYACGPASCCCPPGKLYLGVFGGGGSSTKIDISQYGTAYYLEAAGGPLAVDAFGRTNRRNVSLFGGQVGFQLKDIFPNPCNTQWGLTPAVEWEGYYLRKSSFVGHDINNDTARLPEHDFLVTYPMKTGVFLTNAILNFNFCGWRRFHPYIGAGIGAAVVSISNATAEQVAPPEAGINHYNSNPSDTESTFAAQTKVGLNLAINRNVSVFAEYRWLYLSSSEYAFGSTVYPGHPVTSNWLVRLDPQYYNMGAVGIHFSL